MPIAVVGAIAAIGATVGSTVMQMNAASKQKKAVQQQVAAQNTANQIQSAQANVMAQRDRVAQIREARIRRASVISSAGNAGIGLTGSSGVSGATSSVQSQLGYNLGTMGTMKSFADQLSAANQQEANAQADFYNAGAKGQFWQSIFKGVAGIAGTVNGMAGGTTNAGIQANGGTIFK